MRWFFKGIIEPFTQVNDRGRIMLESKMKQKEIDSMQEHIQYILEYLSVEAEAIRENDLKLWIGKEENEYYVKLIYSAGGIEEQVYEMGRQELKECMEYLSWDYKVSYESNDHAEVVKLYIEL